MNGLRDTLNRRSICHSIGRIIAESFTYATLITLHCSSAAVMPPDLAKRVFASWTYRARRTAGGTFQFIRVTDYGPHPVPEVVFHVIADLPLGVCCAACEEWHMGEASARPLDEDGVDKIARAVVCQPDMHNAQIWGYNGGRGRPPRCSA